MADTVFRERKLRVAEMNASCGSNDPDRILEDAHA